MRLGLHHHLQAARTSAAEFVGTAHAVHDVAQVLLRPQLVEASLLEHLLRQLAAQEVLQGLVSRLQRHDHGTVLLLGIRPPPPQQHATSWGPRAVFGARQPGRTQRGQGAADRGGRSQHSAHRLGDGAWIHQVALQQSFHIAPLEDLARDALNRLPGQGLEDLQLLGSRHGVLPDEALLPLRGLAKRIPLLSSVLEAPEQNRVHDVPSVLGHFRHGEHFLDHRTQQDRNLVLIATHGHRHASRRLRQAVGEASRLGVVRKLVQLLCNGCGPDPSFRSVLGAFANPRAVKRRQQMGLGQVEGVVLPEVHLQNRVADAH
mmetsp:Transcript_114383/g.363494  ORF Transcript_114383/g.363494 Transcript_114383/m.363494 type:complete len:317 (+) Transcript_114383:675-1625(+)